MANEISKLITPDGVSHDIADAVARQASYDVSNKVNKTGDNVTGEMDYIASNINQTTTPSTNQFARYYGVKDSTNKTVSYLETYQHTSGSIRTQFVAQRSINNTDNLNYIYLGVKSDGTKEVYVSEPAAWRSAIGAVNKSGDTMTGALTMTNVNVNVKDTDVQVGTAPSSTLYGNGFYCQSNNGGDLFYVRATQDTSDNVGMQIEARRAIGSTTYYNTVRLGISNNGTKTVGVSDAGAWRTALGLGTMATQNTGSWQPAWANNTLYPIGDDVKIGDQNVGGTLVVQGANADGDVQIRKQNGSVITSIRTLYNNQLNSDLSYTRVNGNVSNDAKCRRYGNIVEFTGQFGLSSSSLARDTILWNGFPKPKTVVYFTARCEGNWTTYSFYISTNGEIKNQQASIPAGTYNCNLVYICQ